MFDKQKLSFYDSTMKQDKGTTTVIHPRRSATTIRVAFQAYDPTAQRYRDVESIRLEVASQKEVSAVLKRFKNGVLEMASETL